MVGKASYESYGKYFTSQQRVVIVRAQEGARPINGVVVSSHKDTICIEVQQMPPAPNPSDLNALRYVVFLEYMGMNLRISACLVNFPSVNSMCLKFTSHLETYKRKQAVVTPLNAVKANPVQMSAAA